MSRILYKEREHTEQVNTLYLVVGTLDICQLSVSTQLVELVGIGTGRYHTTDKHMVILVGI